MSADDVRVTVKCNIIWLQLKTMSYVHTNLLLMQYKATMTVQRMT